MPEDAAIHEKLGSILEAQKSTLRRIESLESSVGHLRGEVVSGLTTVLVSVAKLETSQEAHQRDDDRRIEALQKDVDRAHRKAAGKAEPESIARRAGKVTGIVGVGTALGAALRELFK